MKDAYLSQHAVPVSMQYLAHFMTQTLHDSNTKSIEKR